MSDREAASRDEESPEGSALEENPLEKNPFDAPLTALREKIHGRKAEERLSEVRGTRLRRRDAHRVDYMAEALGLDVSDFIRLVLTGVLDDDEERPDVELLMATLQHVCALVREHESEVPEGPCKDEASKLRAAVELLCSGLL